MQSLTWSFFVLLGCIIIYKAWLCDDAYITFRTVDNFLHGYGLRWNINERVQTYTHPLWMFLLTAAVFITREFYYTAIALNITLSLFALYLVMEKLLLRDISALIFLLWLCTSRAFTDFSTSGMENPLTHFLLAIYLVQFFRESLVEKQQQKKLFSLSLIGSLLVLNRMDLLLFIAPSLLFELFCYRLTWKRIGLFLVGWIPFILWECFSLLYYGFAFPNTAYAKLNTGIPTVLLIKQGLYYLMNSLAFDPATLCCIALVLCFSWGRIKTNPRHFWLSLGILFYLFYILRIGGDFMSGRFLTAPFFCSAILFARIRWQPLHPMKYSYGLGTAIVLLMLGGSLGMDRTFDRYVDVHGIADERRYWSPYTGLFSGKWIDGAPNHDDVILARQDRAADLRFTPRFIIGMYGFYVGPRAHVIDRCALSDPLLARLPVVDPTSWRIGHFERELIYSYQLALAGQGVIEDPNLRKYWYTLSIITKGPLFSPRRLIEIWNFNRGKYDGLLNAYLSSLNGKKQE